jgi:hypothetical protein
MPAFEVLGRVCTETLKASGRAGAAQHNPARTAYHNVHGALGSPEPAVSEAHGMVGAHSTDNPPAANRTSTSIGVVEQVPGCSRL